MHPFQQETLVHVNERPMIASQSIWPEWSFTIVLLLGVAQQVWKLANPDLSAISRRACTLRGPRLQPSGLCLM